MIEPTGAAGSVNLVCSLRTSRSRSSIGIDNRSIRLTLPLLHQYPYPVWDPQGTHLDSDDSLVYLLRSIYIGDRAISDASRIQ